MIKRKDYLPISIRKELGEYAIREVLKKNPEMSIVQVRRIFCYCYFTLLKNNFDGFFNFNKQKKIVNDQDY